MRTPGPAENKKTKKKNKAKQNFRDAALGVKRSFWMGCRFRILSTDDKTRAWGHTKEAPGFQVYVFSGLGGTKGAWFMVYSFSFFLFSLICLEVLLSIVVFKAYPGHRHTRGSE